MPLGSREVLLVIRARNETAHVLGQIAAGFGTLDAAAQQAARRHIAAGAALMGVGTGIGLVGAAGIAFAVDATRAAMDYNKQAALTKTQVDDIGVSLETIKDIGRRVATEIPVPLEALQRGLFDIFSSMDVSVAQSEGILRGFAQAAVAGNVDIQTAGRATIAMMNAFNIPAEEVGRVLDVQFQLVRKGVGTYEEFASTLGRAVPSAQRAGQSIESLAGGMAFATRNGLSTAMAATSVARAFDNVSNPKFEANLNKIGMSAFNADGSFKQLNQITNELGPRLENMTSQERVKAMSDLFSGTGNNIQARRFWDLMAENWRDLDDLSKSMIDSSGVLEEAFGTMMDEPANKAKLLATRWEVLKTQLGDALIPLAEQFIGVLDKVVGWFLNLDEGTKELIAKFIIFGGIGLVLVGTLAAIAGAFLMIWGAIQLLGGFAAIIGGGLTLIPILAAIAGVAFLVYTHWDTLKGWWEKAWPHIQKVAETVFEALKIGWEAVSTWLVDRGEDIKGWIDDNWQNIWDTVTTIFDTAADFISEEIWPKIQAAWDGITTGAIAVKDWFAKNWRGVWDGVVNVLTSAKNVIVNDIWPAIQTAWDGIKRGAEEAWGWLQENVGPIIEEVRGHINDLVASTAQLATDIALNWDQIKESTGRVWPEVSNTVARFGIETIAPLLQQLVNDFGPGVARVWASIQENAGPAWEAIRDIVTTAWDVVVQRTGEAWVGIQNFVSIGVQGITTIVGINMAILYTIWNYTHQLLYEIAVGVWNGLTTVISGAIGVITGILQTAAGIITGDWQRLWDGMSRIASNVTNTILGLMQTFASTALGIIQAWGSNLQAIAGTAWENVKNTFETYKGIVLGIIKAAVDAWMTVAGGLANIFAPAIAACEAAVGAFQSVVNAAGDAITAATNAATTVAQKAADAAVSFGKVLGLSGSSPGVTVKQISTGNSISGSSQGKNIAKQLGGAVWAGSPYVLESNSPEMFIPRVSGRLLTNAQVREMLGQRIAGGTVVTHPDQGNGVYIAPGALNFTFYGTQNANEVRSVVREELEELARTLRKTRSSS